MRMRLLLRLLLLCAATVGLAGAPPALAQREPYGGSAAEREARPGAFDYYTMVLAWSPTYCASRRDDGYDPQCSRDGRPYAFVLHGIWPQYERGYPEFCRTAERPFVPRSIIDGMLDIMPSPRLVIHEYRKHGTCTGLDPAAFFDLARRFYQKVNIPQRFVNPPAPFFIPPGELVQEFVAANPGLAPDMIVIECRGSGQRLREVRICLSREGDFRPCGDNEAQSRLCKADRMYVPPVRASAGPGYDDRQRRPSRRYPWSGERSLLGR